MNEHKDEQKLLDFLKKYRPIPPESSPDFEERIFRAITQESPIKASKFRPLEGGKLYLFPRFTWSIAAGIFVALLGIFAGNYYGNFSAKVEPLDDHHLEDFLVNNWQSTMDDISLEIVNSSDEN